MDGVGIAATVILAGALGWISVVDLTRFRIPNPAVVVLASTGLAYSAYCADGWPVKALIGLVVGFGVFAALGEIFYRRTGQDGLGLGDAKLLGAAGAWLGWLALVHLVALAAVSALIYALIMRRKRLAFGPWLAMSFLILWLVGVRPDG